MPELPEVETVRRGVAPVMEGARIISVELRRPDLRFPFPERFAARISGWRVEAVDRRAKYLLIHLTSGETLIIHLGMSGKVIIVDHDGITNSAPLYHEQQRAVAHDHVVIKLEGPKGRYDIIYNDPRRFGFMDIVPSDLLEESKHFSQMGPEPLGNQFSSVALVGALSGRKTPIKQALLDQRVIAGLGNIYVCEALYRAGISPRRQAGTVKGKRAERLVPAIRDVLNEAIQAGGSTLKDYAAADGSLGYFQHNFKVYDREGEACSKCEGEIKRITQSGRSTFFCSSCQG